MSGTDSRHLLVMEGDELAGVITEHDVVTASTLDPGVESERVDPDPIMTHRFSLDEAPEALAMQSRYDDGVIKAMVHPSE